MPPRARKRFGQHFLVDVEAISRISALCHPRPGELLLEVGPGRGALTRQLLAHGHYTVAVEIDRDLVGLLRSQLRERQLLYQIFHQIHSHLKCLLLYQSKDQMQKKWSY